MIRFHFKRSTPVQCRVWIQGSKRSFREMKQDKKGGTSEDRMDGFKRYLKGEINRTSWWSFYGVLRVRMGSSMIPLILTCRNRKFHLLDKDHWKKNRLGGNTMVWFGNGLQDHIFEFVCQLENCYSCGELRRGQAINAFISSKINVYRICEYDHS